MDLSTDPSDTGHSPQPSDRAPDAEFWPLSGKPYFYVVLNQYHLANRFQLIIPCRITEKLPATKVPAKIICRGKVWDLFYLGNQTTFKKFEKQSWGKFATDNDLAAGDACVFELTEGSCDSSNIEFKVQILKNNFPSELLGKAEGLTANNPISVE
uniref:B3 domain-containing protein Os04g0386900-like n=1 Tax=Erigeron canadensis TaxID=72917 RepID=UPI001CB99689|nr:B3 domain-containing protein Os04g0386900-like [Erigeron canadensis]